MPLTDIFSFFPGQVRGAVEDLSSRSRGEEALPEDRQGDGYKDNAAGGKPRSKVLHQASQRRATCPRENAEHGTLL